MKHIIEQLKQNEDFYNDWSDELAIKARTIGYENFLVLGFVSGGPVFIAKKHDGLKGKHIYRLRADYRIPDTGRLKGNEDGQA